MSEFSRSQAYSDFGKARMRETLSRIASFLTLSHDGLMSFEDAKRLLKPASQRFGGIEVVPIDRIVGSEGRYRDFDRSFLPRREHLKSRWASVDTAYYDDVLLPPVQLYLLGGAYFVRDGNHRISVARMKGQQFIDAEVTVLESALAIEPGMGIEDLKREVLAFERRAFIERTDYERVTGDPSLSFSEPGRYELIEEHVRVHKYFINQNRKDEIPFREALFSWHGEVYTPVILAIGEEGLLRAFPGRTESDLYLFLVQRWDDLKRKYGISQSIADAARDLRQSAGDRGFLGGILGEIEGLIASLARIANRQ